MKRKLILGLVLMAAAILLTTGALALLPGMGTSKEILNEKVDQSKPLVLHFEACHVKLISWQGDAVRVTQGPMYGDKTAELKYGDNTITALSGASQDKKNRLVTMQSLAWISLMLFDKYFGYANEVWDQRYVDFYIYVPTSMSVEAYTSGIMGSANGVDFQSMSKRD